jgi:Bacterial SH3 domain
MKRLISIIIVTAVLLIILPATAQNTIYYTLRAARVRSCASTLCDHLGSIPANTRVEVTGSMDGQKWNGSTLWLQVNFDGSSGYVHRSLLTGQKPGSFITPGAPTYAPQPYQNYLINPALVSTPLPASLYACNNVDDLNCSDFANQRQANAHLQQCPVDEDFLDADNNGYACDALPP